MPKRHWRSKLFFAGLVLFIIGAIGVGFTMKSGEMIEKGEPLKKTWDLADSDISKIAFSSSRDTLIEWKKSTSGKNYVELSGNYSKNDKEDIEKLKAASTDGTSFDLAVPEENVWFNFGKIYAYGQQKLTVYLTEDTKLENLQLKSNSGDMSVSNFKVNSFVSTTSSGELKVNKIEANSVEASSTSGDIELADIKANTSLETSSGETTITNLTGNLEVNGNSGDVTASGIKANNTKIAVESGEIELTNSNIAKLGTLTSSSGDISTLDTKGKLHVESSSGSIELERITNNLKVKTNSGDVDVSFVNPAKDIQVFTDSGEIDIQLPTDYKAIYEVNTNSGSIKKPTSNTNTENRVTVDSSSGDITIEK
ncbi:DUF4097 domain-containing protein [Listeria ivanovii]|uniref:DUF4097 family beta strand repeat-containing protein n=1 Tax=Listeria ivanovii TaxID=1638 RepID=UPI0016233398|nr:DUF4097 domain-containing protein [Listeria ivanovii]MBC2254664.1 DUF4097 domain-containing protein [Listeria ivanovii]